MFLESGEGYQNHTGGHRYIIQHRWSDSVYQELRVSETFRAAADESMLNYVAYSYKLGANGVP